MSTAIANTLVLATSIPHATTIIAGAQSRGVCTSLATNGLVSKAGSVTHNISTSESAHIVVTGRKVEITLASTTVIIAAPSGARQAGSNAVGGSTLEWVVGQQTLRPIFNGVIVASGSESETYTYSLVNVTQQGEAAGRTRMETSGITSFLKTPDSSTLTEALRITPSQASITTEVTSSAFLSTATDTATVTSMPSDGPPLHGTKAAWMAMIFLLIASLAM